MKMNTKVAILAAFSTVAAADTASEYVGFLETSGAVTWQMVTYPSNYTATSASDVAFSDLTDSPDELGAWYGLDMGGTPELTGRVYGDYMYGQINTGTAPSGGDYPGGCCADTLRVYSIDGDGSYTDLALYDKLQTIFDGIADTDSDNDDANYAYANHVFDMTTIDGVDASIHDVVYLETELGSKKVDAIVFFNPSTGDVIQTADGDDFFSWYRKLGTTSTTSSDSIYKIGFDTSTDEQWHQNGVTRFQTKDGTWILAATFRNHGECILVKDPFTYTSADGGGSILQRFGSPDHTFGLSSSDGDIDYMHNVIYTLYPDGTETLSNFVNAQEGASESQCFEWELNLVEEPDSYDDTVFDTTYKSATLSYQTDTWGGCRPVGQGVWLVGNYGIVAVDETNAAKIKALKDNQNASVFQNASVATNATKWPPWGSDDGMPPGPPSDDGMPPGPPGDDDDDSTHVYDSFIRVTLQ